MQCSWPSLISAGLTFFNQYKHFLCVLRKLTLACAKLHFILRTLSDIIKHVVEC